ncbi:5-hydroxytryptamine receptor 3A-like [Acanthopagrus latus]|uniref:5-hydroxytryptamine receptor 3A-like n=1 Tax=Acanthopagrus latus TaxID=8177 RepID=UPI00187BE67D|nr:5-hydroxytryptamine receptor 3A-like [Acanthopagrus latus]
MHISCNPDRLHVLTGPAVMMLAGFLLLLLLTDGESSNSNCSYRDLYQFLKSEGVGTNIMIRPVKNHTSPTVAELLAQIYSVLDVNEREQKFVSYIWIYLKWRDEYISWNPEDFCGIERIFLSNDQLWKPDIIIEEMTDKDKINQSPYLTVDYQGEVYVKNDIKVISTCEMHLYKFPFDNQSCNLSFRSAMHPDKEIKLRLQAGYAETRMMLMEKFKTHEWILLSLYISNPDVGDTETEQSMVVYEINMGRRSALYVVNFMLPVLFFLGLDLSSFLISDSGGEKLSFKVTVLLSVTVMQLILSEILPSTSNRIPLIATYIMGIFGLMMLSLLETILVKYLLEKDSKVNEPNGSQSLSEDCGDKQGKVSLNDCCRGIHSACVCDVSASETPPELLPVGQEVSCSQQTEESHDFGKLSEELREVVKTLSLLLNCRKEETKPGYWTRVSNKINKVFFIFYVIAVTLFLIYMLFCWNTE